MQILKNTYIKVMFLSLLLISTCMLLTGYYPFGEFSFAILDCNSQYIPFIKEFVNKIISGENILFNINKNLGSEGIYNYIYYVTSPFNILFLIFNKTNPLQLVNSLVVIKTILAGLSFCYFLKNEEKTEENITILFSLIYAFSGFMTAYNWCIIWTDVIILTPLIITTLKKSIFDKKYYKRYTIFLAISMFSNLYMTFSLCIFLFLYFLTLKFENKKHFIDNLIIFAVSSISSALLNISIVYLYITAPTNNHTETYDANITIFEFIKEHLFFYNSNILENSAKLYTSVGISVLVAAYVFIGINKTYKIKRLSLLIILILSFLLNPLNMVWHVFDQPNYLFNRFSYLYIFYLLDLAFETYKNKDTIKDKKYIASSGMLIICIIPLFIYTYLNNINISLYAINIILIYVFTHIFFVSKNKKLYLFIMLELILMIFINMKANSNVDIDKYETIHMLKDSDDRTAVSLNCDSYNMNTIDNTNIVSYFSSMHNEASNKKLLNYGFKTTMNSYVAQPYNYIANSIFGISNIASSIEINNNIYTLDKHRDYVYYENPNNTVDYYYYNNPFVLSIGYVVDNNIKELDTTDMTQTDAINEFYNKACGITDVYTKELGFEYVDGWYEFISDDNYETIAINYVYEFISDLTLTLNNEMVYKKENPDTYITLSGIKKGDVIKFKLNNKLKHEPKILILNNDKFKKATSILCENQFLITNINSTKIEGNINTSKDGTLLLSLINNENIKLYIDGNKTETYVIDDIFIGADIDAGEHHIKVCYEFNFSIIYLNVIILFAYIIIINLKKFR